MEEPFEYAIPYRPGLLERKPGASASERAARSKPEDAIAWERGAAGERAVGDQLRRLPQDRWRVFHDVPIGVRGANVDHLAVGTPGVFCINTKNLTGRVVVNPRTLTRNDYRTNYLPKAHEESEKVSQRLKTALGCEAEVEVRAVLAIFADEMEIRRQPSDVAVVDARYLVRWLLDQPVRLDGSTWMRLAACVNRMRTWERALNTR